MLRRRRLEQKLDVGDAARQLGIPTKTLRAVEWDRGDLVGSVAEVDEIERRYADLLGLIVAPRAETQAKAPEPVRPGQPAAWLPLAAGLPLPLAVLLVVFVGETPVLTVMLGLILLSSLLLAGAVLPPAALTRARVPASVFARYRQPLALSAIGILIPVLLSAVLIPLI